ncbi:hypothetical protein PV08_07823 [Exophiala spinifera]|uniref:ZN622/Rei1/Reh1 zinc finger C2H2-type domain-containing protein n=1 Tax=Exophiala spinifera TaxID=91928 RepID=A0A0D1YJC7_9EURO|nr:uncharacterized protein PV08_07823 [Exophiala spinifera]KIW15036.1 hypothetical protein PV08_07823 [Exophiala spinifera]
MAALETESHPNGPLIPSREQTPYSDEDICKDSSSPSAEYIFDEAQCLFCNETSTDLDQNLGHMSRTHGLFVDSTNLLVELSTLLAYFHLIISGYYECLYCGTQRNTLQAVQQHMMAKGHCKYDIMNKEAEYRDFYDFPSSDTGEEMHHNLLARRSPNDPQLPSQAKARKPRRAKPSDATREGHSPTASPFDQVLQTSAAQPQTDAERSSNDAEPIPHSNTELSTRALKQGVTLNNQLAQLRAEDRRSLMHLPTSQQRALLATRHKQMQKARRTEQAQRGRLETAGNTFGRLGTVRLVRLPPHFGNVSGLNR